MVGPAAGVVVDVRRVPLGLAPAPLVRRTIGLAGASANAADLARSSARIASAASWAMSLTVWRPWARALAAIISDSSVRRVAAWPALAIAASNWPCRRVLSAPVASSSW